MNAIALCAGMGTRLRSVVGDLPKPAIKFGNFTLLQRIVNELLEVKSVSQIYINVSTGAKVLLEDLELDQSLSKIRISYESIPWGPSLTVFKTLKISNLGLLVVHGDLLLEAKALTKFISTIDKSGCETSFVAVHRRRSIDSSQRIKLSNSGLVEDILWKNDDDTSIASSFANEDEIVSGDVIGISFGSLFDATQTKVQTVGDHQLVRTVSWYDNEMSYVSQLVRTVKYFAQLISK